MVDHTPGPWTLDDGRHVYCCDRQLIATVWRRDKPCSVIHDDQTTDANARLIAAAPELLDALARLLADYEQAREWLNAYREDACKPPQSADQFAADARAILARLTQEDDQ